MSLIDDEGPYRSYGIFHLCKYDITPEQRLEEFTKLAELSTAELNRKINMVREKHITSLHNEIIKKNIYMNQGIKETDGKLDYSELNLKLLDIAAQRMMDNKHKYPHGNSSKVLDINQLKWALFRHSKKIVQPEKGDDENLEQHLAALICNISMILNQIELQKEDLTL